MALPDPRLPPPATYPPTAILLTTPSGHQTHYLSLLRPTSTRLSTLLARSRLARTLTFTSTHPEDLIERTLSKSAFQHLSDGPRGGIWMLETGNDEVVVCLVEEMEEVRRMRGGEEGEGWIVLGIGVGGCEGRVYLLHPCERPGMGGEEEVGLLRGEAGAGANGGGRRPGEVGREILGEVVAGARAGARTGARELWRLVMK
jgi:hypothetical protein